MNPQEREGVRRAIGAHNGQRALRTGGLREASQGRGLEEEVGTRLSGRQGAESRHEEWPRQQCREGVDTRKVHGFSDVVILSQNSLMRGSQPKRIDHSTLTVDHITERFPL